MAGYCSYADFFERGPQRAFVVQNCLRGTANISLTRLSGNPPGVHRAPKLPEMLLIVAGSGSFRMRYNLGLGWRQGRFRRGDLLLAPPDTINEYHTDSESSFGTIALPLSFIAACLADETGTRPVDFDVLHDRLFRDRLIEAHIFSLLRSPSPADPLSVDERLVSLMDCLVAKAGRADARRQRRIRLDNSVASRIMAYVEDNLSQELTLSQLSVLADLSLAHFARAFRMTLGMPPHRYVLQRRIERAKALLRGKRQPIAEIALECGFSSQAHLTSVFSRYVGTTPARYRKSN